MKERNRSSITNYLILGATIVACVILILLGKNVVDAGKDVGEDGLGQFGDAVKNTSDLKYSQYEGLSISGDALCDLYNTFKADKSEVTITVKTKMMTAEKKFSFSGGSPEALVTSSTDEEYINPAGQFACTVTRNDSGMVTNLSFVQV